MQRRQAAPEPLRMVRTTSASILETRTAKGVTFARVLETGNTPTQHLTLSHSAAGGQHNRIGRSMHMQKLGLRFRVRVRLV